MVFQVGIGTVTAFTGDVDLTDSTIFGSCGKAGAASGHNVSLEG